MPRMGGMFERPPRTRAGVVAVFAALMALSGCKREDEQRRLNLANLVDSRDPAERARAKQGLIELVAEYPDDIKARNWLALCHVADHEYDKAREQYQEIVSRSKDAQEVEKAKEALVLLEAKAQARFASHATSRPIVLGKGAGGVLVAQSLSEVERALGECTMRHDAPPAFVCQYPAGGLDVGFYEGRVVRIGVYGDERIAPAADFDERRYAIYTGKSAEGVKLGMKKDELVALLGQPAPAEPAFGSGSGRDGSFHMEVLTWPDRGLSAEISLSKEGLHVGAIHIPLLKTLKPQAAKPDAERAPKK
jgi:hypothetical protein